MLESHKFLCHGYTKNMGGSKFRSDRRVRKGGDEIVAIQILNDNPLRHYIKSQLLRCDL
jgi:hypothetical protein